MKQIAGIQLSSSSAVEQILNIIETFPKYELNQSNMRPIDQCLKMNKVIVCYKAFTYDKLEEKFVRKDFALYPNLLVQNNEQFLILSSCFQESKVLKYKHTQIYGIILTSIIGQTYLFFESISNYVEVNHTFKKNQQGTKKIKKYCKQQGFSKKYTINEKLKSQNFFSCVKNKNGKQFIVEVYRDSDLQKNYENYETLMNEIHILMSLKDTSLLPFKALYQDKNILFLLYNHWQGETLFRIIQQSQKFSENEKAQILWQIAEFVKKIHFLGLVHCKLTPNNIILLKTNNQVIIKFIINFKYNPIKIAVTHFGYKEVTYYYWKWLKEKVQPQWLPAEITTQNLQDDGLSLFLVDSYQFGCLTYFLEFYEPQGTDPNLSQKDALKHFTIDYKTVMLLSQADQNDVYINSSIQAQNVRSRGIIDLMVHLLNPNPLQRQSIQFASKHQWFINQKSKLNQQKQMKKLEIDYSIRTIIELRENSEREIMLTKMQRFQQELEVDEIDEISENEFCEDNNTLSNKIEVLNTFSLYTNIRQKKIEMHLN